jgi:hypothetical protein
MEKKSLLNSWLWRLTFGLAGLFLLLTIFYTVTSLKIALYS